MIELLIDRRTREPIVAKPVGSPWGFREFDGPNLCVVTMADPPAELLAAIDAGRVVANPFAEYAPNPVTKRPVMVRQSTVKLKFADVRRGARVRAADMESELARP